MPLYVRVSGVWKEVAQPAVRVGGVWKNITDGYVRVGGVWKRFYQNLVFSLSGAGAYVFDSPASFSVNRNGTYTLPFGDSANWVTPATSTIGDAYEVRAQLVSGTTPTGAALNDWLTISEARFWTVGITQSCVLNVEIRRAADSVVVASNGTVTVQSDTIGSG